MKRLLYIACVLMLVACGRSRGPQLPSRWLGRTEVDSAQLDLMEFNQRMVEEADAELMHYALEQNEPYVVYRGGTWVYIVEKGNADLPRYTYGQECTLHLRVYPLSHRSKESAGQPVCLLDDYRRFKLGSSELPFGVSEVVRELNPGAQARLLVPWYSAYGVQGNGYVQPYQNVIIDLTIEE